MSYPNQATAKKGGRPLLPWEIEDIMNKALDSPEFSRDCEPAYLNSVSDFVTGSIIEPMVKTRKKYGLYEAREWEEETDGMDLDIGADGESFAADPLLPFRCGSLTGIRTPRF